jgi:cell division septation protein DedD
VLGAHVQEHLKIRLTGAIILVIVVVMLVPEMFRGRPPGGATHGGAMVDELPLRSYTIDLRNNAAPQSGAAASIPGPVAAGVAASAAVTTPASAAVTLPTATVPPVTMSTTAPAPAPAPAPASASALKPAPTLTAAAAVPAPKPEPTGASTPLLWTVQVGTFSRRDYAERMVKQVRAKGFVVMVAGPDERGLYRVRSASVNMRASAEALRQKMVAQGLKPIVNTAP